MSYFLRCFTVKSLQLTPVSVADNFTAQCTGKPAIAPIKAVF
ncbi:MAG: hypothetical protein AAF685_18515 [Cyanobacteria bacterium P01_C01_bin.89]